MKALAAWLALAGVQATGPVELPHPFPPDYVHYSAGGLMSRPTEVFIDLATRRALVAAAEHDGLPLVRHSVELNPAEVALFRRDAAAMIARGGTTPACRRRARPDAFDMPSMDARASLWAGLAGKEAGTPVRFDCWSRAADALVAHLGRYLSGTVETR